MKASVAAKRDRIETSDVLCTIKGLSAFVVLIVALWSIGMCF